MGINLDVGQFKSMSIEHPLEALTISIVTDPGDQANRKAEMLQMKCKIERCPSLALIARKLID
jgi:hypothetical protein